MSRDNLSWLRDWDVDLAAVLTPVRLVYGDNDRMAELGHAEWLQAWMTQGFGMLEIAGLNGTFHLRLSRRLHPDRRRRDDGRGPAAHPARRGHRRRGRRYLFMGLAVVGSVYPWPSALQHPPPALRPLHGDRRRLDALRSAACQRR